MEQIHKIGLNNLVSDTDDRGTHYTGYQQPPTQTYQNDDDYVLLQSFDNDLHPDYNSQNTLVQIPNEPANWGDGTRYLLPSLKEPIEILN